MQRQNFKNDGRHIGINHFPSKNDQGQNLSVYATVIFKILFQKGYKHENTKKCKNTFNRTSGSVQVW